ncbi:MAG: hypothetical protein QHJ74_15790, partial [Anaerolineae bacterium]|nr:hypothetical protein [Anaerolineae bacterium]
PGYTGANAGTATGGEPIGGSLGLISVLGQIGYPHPASKWQSAFNCGIITKIRKLFGLPVQVE